MELSSWFNYRRPNLLAISHPWEPRSAIMLRANYRLEQRDLDQPGSGKPGPVHVPSVLICEPIPMAHKLNALSFLRT